MRRVERAKSEERVRALAPYDGEMREWRDEKSRESGEK
jgi:hypothetical protein